ncbi:phage tail tape measure protein [Bradyrhizobium roseum]|uniref:phage tail tape measure protein n=1 Tax=Bradyrhizobium roseum TaxID=3056648 RepID=UPI002619812B|nr:phage tail tape measure protein [Bradyrhizobium roseus]WKA29341.1 phage tail tape measure protein [Bradyrhizobium roseus]
MSDNLSIHTRLTATNEASPAIRKLIADLEKLKVVAKTFGASFSNVGKAAFQSLDGVTRASKSAADQMRGLSNVAERAAKSYANDWNKANASRMSDARSMYSKLMNEERQYQALVAKRSAGPSSPHGNGTSVRRIAGGTFLGVGAASATHQLSHSVVAAERSISRGIASAFRERLKISRAETQSEIFGDLSASEVKKLRKDSLDRLGIKFGTGAEGTLGVATELSKAGLGKEVLGDATELALKAKMALDVSAEDTAKLFGGLASFIQFDKMRYGSISNAIAVANKSSKASGTEIIEGMKRGLSAIATTGGKLSPEQLAGLVGTAIDVGIQPGKSGNFISHFVGTVGSSDTQRGQKAKDAQEAAQHLGFGSRQNMAQSMRDNPLETIYKILDGLAKLPEKMKIRVAKDLGGEMWFDEILQMVLAKDKLKSMQKDIAADTGFLDKAALKAIRSISGAHASVIAAAKLAQEKVGGGFDRAFTQISDAILRHADTFNFDSVTSHVTAFVDGLRSGFGFRDWGQAIVRLVAQFDAGTIATWRAWGRGFASGLKSWGENLASAFNVIKRLTGTGDDAESTGKLVANLAVLATSLIVVNPLLLLLAGTMALLSSPFAAFIAAVIALKKALDWVADKMFAAFVSIVDAIKGVALSMVNKVRGWMGLNRIEGSGPSRMPGESNQDFQKRIDDFTLERLKQPTNYSGATDFSGRRRNADLSENFTKFAGKIERAAFMSGGLGGGIRYAALGGGSGRGISSNGGSRNIVGEVPGIITSTPGTALPGLNRLGGNGIIRRDRIPSFDGSGGSAASGGRSGGIVAPNVITGATPGGGAASGRSSAGKSSSAGSAGTGDAVGWAEKYKGMNEYSDTKILASVLGGDVRGKSNAWCARFVNKALAEAGGKGTGSAVANSFQRYGTAVRPADVKRNDVLLQTHGRGYNVPGGHVGMATGKTRMRNGKMEIEMIAGNDGDSVRTRWISADDPDLMVRRSNVGTNVSQGVTNAVPPSGLVQNVPPADAVSRGFTGPGMMRGGSGVQIHINGSSHDPEALATLVQRRVDESMNWRTHDTASEYT